MTTNIIVTLQVEGLHNWPAANKILPQVGYLSDLHRHIFYITCKLPVYHDDRDVEFIDFKHRIQKYLNDRYYNTDKKCLLFEALSCEMIAKELLEYFKLSYCSVMEDNENGAEIFN